MIPLLLRPLWVLGETMGRYRPNPQQLYFPSTPRHLSFRSSHIYMWLESGPLPYKDTPILSCSVMDGEAEGLTLALWGLHCYLRSLFASLTLDHTLPPSVCGILLANVPWKSQCCILRITFKWEAIFFLLDWGQLVKHKGQLPGWKVSTIQKEEKILLG